MISRKSVPAAAGEDATILVALELGKASWLATPLSGRVSRHSIPGGDAVRLLSLIGEARRRVAAAGGSAVRVVACYDGLRLQRRLSREGIETQVLEPASLPVDHRARRAKHALRLPGDRPAGRRGLAAGAGGLAARRAPDLPDGSAALARGGGRQAAASRAPAADP